MIPLPTRKEPARDISSNILPERRHNPRRARNSYYTVVLGALFFISVNLVAQNNNLGAVTGSVIDSSTNGPLEFVYVLVHNTKDTSLVTGTATSKKGKFSIKNLRFGDYFLKFSMIGYRETSTPVFTIDSLRKNVNVGTISLTAEAVNLDEVSVTAERSTFNFSVDRKVYNVSQDIMSNVGSAGDLLENIPSVQVDIDGVVSLRGSSNVLLMINGKESTLLEKKNDNFLDQIPASSIEKIEVITNPSANYKSEGKSGIINIVLKKNIALGTHGNLAINMGEDGRYNGHVRLNYNPGNINVYGSYTLRRDNRNHINTDERAEAIVSPTSLSHYTSTLLSHTNPLSHLITLGVDYHPDEQNSMGTSGSYFQNNFTRTDSSFRVYRNASNVITNRYERNSLSYESNKEYSFSTYIQHDFSKNNHKLRLEFTASQSPKVEDNHFTNIYIFPRRPDAYYDNALVNERDTKNQLSIDYFLPISDKSSFQAGYAGEFNRTSLDFYAEYSIPGTDTFAPDKGKTSQFLFHETLHALYSTLKYTFGRFSLLGGIRAEQTFQKSDLSTLDSSVANNYFNLYPSIHLSYKFSNITEMQFSYSRRTGRPRARDLNPFPEYRDPKNISSGDPNLLPEYVHSLELGCQFQNENVSFLPSLFYRYTYNSVAPIKQLVNSATLSMTKQNVANDKSAGLELVVSVKVGTFFTSHVSGTGFYEEMDASNIGFSQAKSKVSWSGTWSSNFNFTRSSRLQVNSHFNSFRLTPQAEYFPSTVVNMGFRQEVVPDKIFLILTVSDIFKTMKRHYELNIPRLQQTVVNNRDSRIIYLGFTYYIGSTQKKSKDEQLPEDNDF